MSHPPYPSYSDSGTDWIGIIPAHWNTRKLKWSASLVTSGSRGWAEYYSDEGSYFVRIGNLTRGSLDIDDSDIRNVTVPAGAEGSRTVTQAGDILFSITAFLGSVAIVDQCHAGSYVSQHVSLVRLANKDILSNYVGYFALSEIGQRQLKEQAYGGTKIQLSLGDIRDLQMPLPPVSEQLGIAAFLNREAAQIDELIGKQNALVELLGERRKAIITRAVTKGLDPNVPMKDSGVEWMGDVPSSWTVSQIKWMGAVQRGASPRPIDDPKYFDEEGEWAWVRIADVSASDGNLWSTTQRLSQLGSSLSVRLEPGSLILSIAGSVGKPCVTRIRACIHDGFVYFPKLPVDPMFLFRIFEAGQCFAGLGKMGTQLNLNTDTVGSVKIAMPPAGEVATILSYLAVETARIDGSISKAIQLADLLNERRHALITAAVTGKIDVRELVS